MVVNFLLECLVDLIVGARDDILLVEEVDCEPDVQHVHGDVVHLWHLSDLKNGDFKRLRDDMVGLVDVSLIEQGKTFLMVLVGGLVQKLFELAESVVVVELGLVRVF